MRVWTLDEATAALPEVRALVQRLREQTRAAQQKVRGNGGSVSGNGHGPAAAEGAAVRELLAELDRIGIIVRDPERGLIDFPAETADGRTYLLCWLDGEASIDWWHWPDAGFAGRTPLSEPPD